MTRLQGELQRLFQADAAGSLIAPEGTVRAFLMAVARPSGWDALAAVWRGVQADLDLPAPVIAVSGTDSHQLWFSLAQAVPAQQAFGVLQALQSRYLDGVPPERVRLLPAPDPTAASAWQHASAMPPVEMAPGRWSAFVAPDLASLFEEDACLDMPPGDEAQADLLSRVKSASADAWQRALARLDAAATPKASGERAPMPTPHTGAAPATSAAWECDPRRFLLAVMNDPTAPLALRIEAAKALLPHVAAPAS